MVKQTKERKKFMERAKKKSPVGMKLNRLGKLFKIKKYS